MRPLEPRRKRNPGLALTAPPGDDREGSATRPVPGREKAPPEPQGKVGSMAHRGGRVFGLRRAREWGIVRADQKDEAENEKPCKMCATPCSAMN